MKEQNQDYSKYEGIQTHFTSADGIIHEARIAGFDPEIGITVTAHDDPDNILYCIIRPEIFKKKFGAAPDGTDEQNDAYFDKVFAHFLEALEANIPLANEWAEKRSAIKREHNYAVRGRPSIRGLYSGTDLCAFR